VPSEGGESAHSVALTTLSNKKLEGIPVAQKIADKKFRYLDASGNEIAKQKALESTGGIVYYQDAVDPSRGRLRHRGTFVSEDDARTIVSGSRAGSDVANLRELEEHEAILRSIDEEREEAEVREVIPCSIDEEHEQSTKKPKKMSFGKLSKHAIVITFLVISGLTAMQALPRGPMQLQHLAKQDTDFERLGRDLSLSQDIVQLLKADEMTANESGEMTTGNLLDMPEQAAAKNLSLERQKSLAASEVHRILSCQKAGDILGTGFFSSRRRQQQEFQRIVRLLHPDKGLVSAGDQRALLALRLTFAARRSAGLRG